MTATKGILSITILICIFCSCEYNSIETIDDIGFVEGYIETYSGASKIVTVSDANIYLYPNEELKGISKNGKFFLDNVPIGNYILKITKNGFYDGYHYIDILKDKTVKPSFFLYSIDTNNHFPSPPKSPFPPDNGIMFDTAFVLAWSSKDPDNNPLYYDLYISDKNPPLKCIGRGIREDRLKIDSLKVGTTYYWRVRVRDYYGAQILGDIWQFQIREL